MEDKTWTVLEINGIPSVILTIQEGEEARNTIFSVSEKVFKELQKLNK